LVGVAHDDGSAANARVVLGLCCGGWRGLETRCC
jgi:hypothetical protein